MTRKSKHSAGQGVQFHNEEAPPTRAIVVHVDLPGAREGSDHRSELSGAALRREPATALSEIVGLAEAIELEIVDALVVRLPKFVARTLIGLGKVQEIAALVSESEAELVVFNATVSPAQQRNLERALDAKVLDRTGLILEIFGRRARTREGVLQVELAHLRYQKSRLVRSWTHLERQRGGAGFLGGPGETQIEADRRILQEKIAKIEKQLKSVMKTRQLHRKGRERVPYQIVALAGYTNAGKSTLFNALTDAEVVSADMLFATLDPTMRRLRLKSGRDVILSDTVGFISDLPTTLIAAFRATLEEVLSADLILHVRDISHPDSDAQADDVGHVLAELGISDRQRENMIEVWNKIDRLDPAARQEVTALASRRDDVTMVSAVTGEGLDRLVERIEQGLGQPDVECAIILPSTDGAGVAWLYRHGTVLQRDEGGDDGMIHLEVRLDPVNLERARARFGSDLRIAKGLAAGRAA